MGKYESVILSGLGVDKILLYLDMARMIYLAPLHYLKYLMYCTLNYSPNGYFYMKCTLLMIMSYNLIEKDKFFSAHITEYLLFVVKTE